MGEITLRQLDEQSRLYNRAYTIQRKPKHRAKAIVMMSREWRY